MAREVLCTWLSDHWKRWCVISPFKRIHGLNSREKWKMTTTDPRILSWKILSLCLEKDPCMKDKGVFRSSHGEKNQFCWSLKWSRSLQIRVHLVFWTERLLHVLAWKYNDVRIPTTWCSTTLVPDINTSTFFTSSHLPSATHTIERHPKPLNYQFCLSCALVETILQRSLLSFISSQAHRIFNQPDHSVLR